MDLPEVKINTSRSGFDMSQRLVFSAKAGEMIPVFCQEVIPSNKKKIRFEWFTRTQPLDTAAYTRLREYVDFYFVPYEQLWKNWKMFALQMEDNSIYASDINSQQSISDMHPYFTTKQVADYIYNLNHAKGLNHAANENCLGYNRAMLSCKLLNYLGYGDYTPYLDRQYAEPSGGDTSLVNNYLNVPLNPFPLLAYQKIYQDKIRNTQWEKSSPETYNLDYIKGSGDCQIPVEDIDFDSRISMFDLQYMNWNKDYYMGLLPRSQYGTAAVVPLEVPQGNVSKQLTPVAFEYVYNAKPGVYPDGLTPLYGNITNSAPIDEVHGGVYVKPTTNNVGTKIRFDGVSFSQALSDTVSGLNILLLRQYEALQRYNEVRQSAPTDYKSQIEKLFGVSLDWRDSNEVRWLGGVSRNIDINDIVNTNLESASSMPTIHGKGVGVGDGSVDFSTDGEYGLILGIYHVRPILEYSLTAPLPLNTKFKFSDYAQPAFDRIGLQAVSAAQLFNSPNLLRKVMTTDDVTADQVLSSILGYGPRYLDYKTTIDRVVGVAASTEKSWVAPVDDDYLLKYGSASGDSYLPSVAINSTQYFNYTTFKINPAILNDIFGVWVDGSLSNAVDSSVDTDQFLCNLYCDVKDVKNLDYDGMPY